MKPFFTPIDFYPLRTSISLFDHAAQIANAKLEAALGPVVYGKEAPNNILMTENEWEWSNKPWQSNAYTHTARLFNIQEIERKECEHSRVTEYQYRGFTTHYVCSKCGKKLKPTGWSVVE